jgi:hypothetical protein
MEWEQGQILFIHRKMQVILHDIHLGDLNPTHTI